MRPPPAWGTARAPPGRCCAATNRCELARFGGDRPSAQRFGGDGLARRLGVSGAEAVRRALESQLDRIADDATSGAQVAVDAPSLAEAAMLRHANGPPASLLPGSSSALRWRSRPLGQSTPSLCGERRSALGHRVGSRALSPHESLPRGGGEQGSVERDVEGNVQHLEGDDDHPQVAPHGERVALPQEPSGDGITAR
jgi:hypothetical protein